jgi:LysR family transcriptional regulator, glycine cleavage system transcriptional activator
MLRRLVPSCSIRKDALKNMARLPPLDSLYFFAVAARHLSFTAAASELHRTQSAVSHRIKALESEIGVILFNRRTRGLELTKAGEVLANQLNGAIRDIGRTIADLSRIDEVRRLRVTMLPSVASRWLMPRLPRFYQHLPNVQVQVIADPQIIDLRTEKIDLAIRFGHGRYRGHEATLLMKDRVLPVCSPALAARFSPVDTIDELLQMPLLHDSAAEGDGSLSDWRSWLDQLGRPDAACRAGQHFSHAGLSIEAAVLGLGVALARLSLVADHLTSGTLVSPLPVTTPTAFAYHIIALPEVAASPDTTVFTDWLHAEARDMAALTAGIRANESQIRKRINAPSLPSDEATSDLPA